MRSNLENLSKIDTYVIVLIVGCKPKQNIKTLKLGHGLDVSHPVHKGIVFFAEDLNKKIKWILDYKDLS